MVIDWRHALTHLLWISGAALVLGIFSHLDWQASADNGRVLTVLRRVVRSWGFSLGMALTCLGAGLAVSRPWERIVWLLLAAGFACRAAWPWLNRWREPSR